MQSANKDAVGDDRSRGIEAQVGIGSAVFSWSGEIRGGRAAANLPTDSTETITDRCHQSA